MLRIRVQFIGDNGGFSKIEEWDVSPETLTKLRAVATLIPESIKILAVWLHGATD